MNERNKARLIAETLDRIQVRADAVSSTVSNKASPISSMVPRAGYGFITVFDDRIYKTTTPQYLYNLPFGYPRYIDVNEIRRLSKSPYVRMVIGTIVNELCGVKWDIVPRDKDNANSPAVQAHIKEVKEFFENPNDNDESFEQVRRKYLEDLLVLDAATMVKVFNKAGKFANEIYAIDGGSINRNPNIHGNMAGRDELVSPFFDHDLMQTSGDEVTNENRNATYESIIYGMDYPPAYFQYGYANAARPVPLGRREIIYMMMYPNTYSHYGLSAISVLMDTIQMLIYGIRHNLEYFTKDYIPKGILQQAGFTAEECEAFGEKLTQSMRHKDTAGDVVRKQWHIPVVGTETKWVPIQYTPQELQLITQQEWFTKIVWAVFGITSGELGFTADANRAVDITQSKVFRRKMIRPSLNLEEYMLNTMLIWNEFYDDVMFKFDIYDLEEDLTKHELYEKQVKNRLRTVNEIREDMGLEPIDGEDELKQQSTFGSNPFDKNPFSNPKEERENQQEYEDNVKKKAMADRPMVLGENERMTPKKMEKEIEKILDLSRKRMIELVRESLPRADIMRQLNGRKDRSDIVEKALGSDVIKRISGMFGVDFLRGIISKSIIQWFAKGVEKAEKEIDMNFIPSKEALEYVKSYALDNVKDLAEETKNDIRAELQRGMMANEGITKLSERITGVFDTAKTRANAIARTETNRAMNIGHVTSYEQSGMKGKKRWVSTNDDRTSEACKSLDGKEVGLGKNFKYKDWEGPYPPQHCNCRSRIIFIPEGG